MFKTLAAALTLALAVTTSNAAMADWHCRCGTTVHVDYPTQCPVCDRHLPNDTPPFTPPGGGSISNDGTGMTLGVSVYSHRGRLMVEDVLPRTPADGRLFSNDQMVKAAFRDPMTGDVHRLRLRTPNDLSRLKVLAGPGTKVALEVFRPTSGTRSFFVRFATNRPSVVRGVFGGGNDGAAAEEVRATTITEDRTGEASRMLEGEESVGGTNDDATLNERPRRGNNESADDLLNGGGF